MTKLFLMIVEGFTRFILWVNKFTLFQNSFSIFTGVRITSRKFMLLALAVFLVAYVALLVAFFYYMIQSIVTVYNLVSNFLEQMQNMNSSAPGIASPILQPFFMLLHSSGFVAGFQASFPFLASAVSFRLMSALYKTIINLNRRLTNMGLDLIKVITAA